MSLSTEEKRALEKQRALELRLREQRNFEEWITRDTSLGPKYLEGYRDEHGLMDYEDIDVKNKWSGWLAARTGQHSWEAP
jgi:hypothetical protein